MRISQLSTLAKTAVASADYLLTANTAKNNNRKLLVSNLFPTITNYGSTSGAVSIISAVTNKNEFALSKIVAKSSKIAVTGGGGAADISIDLGTVTFADLSGTVINSQLAGNIDLTSKVMGILPVGNGGTGSSAATFCNLASNVTGTLPVANGGTGLTSFTANKLFYASSTSAIAQLDTVGTAGYLLIGTGSKPLWRSVGNTASISWTLGAGSLSADVISIPALTGNIGWAAGSGREVKPANTSGSGDALTIAAGTSTGSNIGGQLNLNAGGGGASTGADILIKSGASASGSSNWGGTIKIQQQDKDTSNTTDVVKIYHNMVGVSNNQSSSITPAAMLHVEQSDAAAGNAVLQLDQDDVDQPFTKYVGTSAASTANSVSSLHGTFPNHTNANDGWIRINVNGTDKWIPYFHTPA
jgi:hypothetical protein